MPKLGSNTPSYRRHKPIGQAMVALDGHYFYLGPYGSKASKIEDDRLIGEWLTNGRRLPQSQQQFTLTVLEIVAAF